MDQQIRILVAAASRIGVRIDPVSDPDTKRITVNGRDRAALVATARRLIFSSMETVRITHILGNGRDEVILSDRDARDLAIAIERLDREVERDKRIRRGQYVGPMSGSEAVKFMRGVHGR